MHLLATPANGLSLVDCEDPSGNDQPTVKVIHTDGDGNVTSPGLYLGVHGGGPLNIRALRGNASPSGEMGGIFNMAEDGRLVVAEL